MYTVYGIPNCNTVKKALDWLNKEGIAYEFHDYKKKGITAGKLQSWAKQTGWEALVNKKGTTWRQLDAAAQAAVNSEAAAIELMQEKTSVIKRPLIEKKDKIVALGFDETHYQEAFQKG